MFPTAEPRPALRAPSIAPWTPEFRLNLREQIPKAVRALRRSGAAGPVSYTHLRAHETRRHL
eukprot:7282356-Prorocentrum_lima.AAC.1